MPNPFAFYLTGLLLQFFQIQDYRKANANKLSPAMQDYLFKELTRVGQDISRTVGDRYLFDAIPPIYSIYDTTNLHGLEP